MALGFGLHRTWTAAMHIATLDDIKHRGLTAAGSEMDGWMDGRRRNCLPGSLPSSEGNPLKMSSDEKARYEPAKRRFPSPGANIVCGFPMTSVGASANH